MKRIYLLLILLLFTAPYMSGQRVALKNNIVTDATATPNLSVEIALARHISLNLSGEYNGWDFNDEKSLKHWTVSPELRGWLSKSMDGWYAGINGIYSDINYSGYKMIYGMDKEYSYDGNAYGGGISAGYQLYLSPHWNMEFGASVGYLHFKYDKRELATDVFTGNFTRDYFGPTNISISFSYIIN